MTKQSEMKPTTKELMQTSRNYQLLLLLMLLVDPQDAFCVKPSASRVAAAWGNTPVIPVASVSQYRRLSRCTASAHLPVYTNLIDHRKTLMQTISQWMDIYNEMQKSKSIRAQASHTFSPQSAQSATAQPRMRNGALSVAPPECIMWQTSQAQAKPGGRFREQPAGWVIHGLNWRV
jgi:hypothetical protein